SKIRLITEVAEPLIVLGQTLRGMQATMTRLRETAKTLRAAEPSVEVETSILALNQHAQFLEDAEKRLEKSSNQLESIGGMADSFRKLETKAKDLMTAGRELPVEEAPATERSNDSGLQKAERSAKFVEKITPKIVKAAEPLRPLEANIRKL